jgi:hypothetical protein
VPHCGVTDDDQCDGAYSGDGTTEEKPHITLFYREDGTPPLLTSLHLQPDDRLGAAAAQGGLGLGWGWGLRLGLMGWN